MTKKKIDNCPGLLDFVIDKVTGLKLRDATREQVLAVAAKYEAKEEAARRMAALWMAVAKESK